LKIEEDVCQEKPPTTGDRLRAQHQWHARFARGGFSTTSFPSLVDNIVATPQEMKRRFHFCAEK